MGKRKNYAKFLITIFTIGLFCTYSALLPVNAFASSTDAEKYIENLASLSQKYDNELFSKIVVDKENNTIQKDNDEKIDLDEYNLNCNDISTNDELIPAEPVLDMIGEGYNYTEKDDNKDGISEYYDEKSHSVKKEYVGYISTDKIEKEYNLEVENSDNKIIITSPYQTKRIYATLKNAKITNTYGAIEKLYDGKGGVVLQYKTENATKSAYEKLKKDSTISAVSLDEVLSVSAISDRIGAKTIQSDRYISYLKDNGKNTAITVAVIDTGAETTHSLLKNRLVAGYNYVSKSTKMLDDNGHGTHVSGIVVDNTPSNVKVMPIKVMNANGNGTSTAISAGIDYAVKKGCKVINMSLGGDCTSTACPIYKSVNAAIKAGVTVCVAAGNEAGDTKNVCPANITGAITVAACSSSGNAITNFTNFGSAVDVTAPGEYIESSYLHNTYEKMSGTSMACPFVAASVALLLIDNNKLTPSQVEAKLKSTCTDMLIKGNDKYTGAGIVNFGLLLGDKDILPDSIGGSAKVEMNYFKHAAVYFAGTSVSRSENDLVPTDRSFTVENTNPAVATYDGRFIVPKGVGESQITLTTASGKSFTTNVKMNKCEVWTDYAASSFASGNGTSSSPYIIKTPQQLAKLANDVRGGKTYKGKYFKLYNDIDLAGKYWISIMYINHTAYYDLSVDSKKAFMGVFDGNNKKIKNMTTYNDAFVYNWGDFSPLNCEWYSNNTGLFGQLDSATIKNVGIENAYCTATISGGLLAGDIYQNTTISNCYTSGFTTGNGLLGNVNNYSIKVSNCYSSADVLGSGIATCFYASNQGYTVIASNVFFCGNRIENDGIENKSQGGFTNFLQSSSTKYYCRLYNCFSATTNSNGIGFSGVNDKAKLYKCYYQNTNKYGIKSNKSKSLTQLAARKPADFKSKAFYTTKSNWNSSYYWDFTNTWAISSGVNNGYPYLKKNKPVATKNNSSKYWKDYAATSYAGGSGTKSNPYLISNAAQLAKFAKDYQFGGGTGKYFKLTADIDLAGKEWYPVGAGVNLDITEDSQVDKKRYRFYGRFDGAGYTISNMTINSKGDYLGFISHGAGGYVKNLNFKNASVNGNGSLGIVVGRMEMKFNIANCNVDGVVSGSSNYVAGVVGYCDSNKCVVSNVHCTALVKTENDVWNYGIVGSSRCIIDRCSYVNPESNTFFTNSIGSVSNSYCISGETILDFPTNEDTNNVYLVYAKGGYLYTNNGEDKEFDGKDIAKLKNKATYTTFNFENIWDMQDGDYPTLRSYTYNPQEPYSFPKDSWNTSHIAKSYAGGTGTKTNPYLIGNVGQLLKMRQDVINSANNNKYYRLIRNIDMGGKYLYFKDTGGYFVTFFNLDGNNKTISNLILKNGEGLFEYDNYGCIKNLNLTNVQGTSSCALLAYNDGIIENCSISGKLGSYNCIGGICGNNINKISKCFVNLQLDPFDSLIAEYSCGTIENCYAINGGKNSLCGSANESMRMINCYCAGSSELYVDGIFPYKYDLTKAESFSTFDFDKVWQISPDENNGMPTLRRVQSKKIHYNLNGGKNASYQATDYIPGQTVALKNPARDFYVFKGWYSNSALTDRLDKIPSTNKEDVEIYAKWSVGYKVVFHTNVANDKTKTQTIERNVSTKLSSNTFTRKGYVFKGWATSKKGKVVYKNGAGVKNLAKAKGTKHLYAVWEKK